MSSGVAVRYGRFVDPRVKQRNAGGSIRFRIAGAVGLLVAVGVFILVAVIVPDGEATAASIGQGLVIGAAFAAVPVAILVGPVDSSALVSLGVGMTFAGFLVTPGGNLLGLVMAATGLVFVGASGLPRLSLSMLIYAFIAGVVIAAAHILALGHSVLTGLVSLVLSATVMFSSRLRDSRTDDRAMQH
jgi:hypothetical protein